jgi:hypothetical protein
VYAGHAADAIGPAGIKPLPFTLRTKWAVSPAVPAPATHGATGPGRRVRRASLMGSGGPTHARTRTSPCAAELAALIATFDAVSLVADRAADDGDGDRQRAGPLDLVLIDYRTFCSAARR